MDDLRLAIYDVRFNNLPLIVTQLGANFKTTSISPSIAHRHSFFRPDFTRLTKASASEGLAGTIS